jgi:hypothetical protein
MNRSACYTILLAIGLMGAIGCSSARPAVVNFPAVIAVTPTAGTPQSHAVNGAFGTSLTVTVTSNGSPASGMVVTFRAPTTGPGGTFADTASATTTATTDSSGLATPAAFAANAMAGAYTVTASAPGAAAVATFNLTNTIAAPAAIKISAGQNSPSAAINSAFPQFVVTVVDSGGNPVSGAIVTFTAPTTGASGLFADTNLNTTQAIASSSGVATSTVFTANAISGTYSVTASSGGVTATFNVTNQGGAPATITINGGTPQNTTINTPFATPLSVTVLDAANNPVAGAFVIFSAPTTAGAASGTFLTSGTATETDTTNSNGVASATFTANGVTGTYQVTASIGTLSPVVFSLTNQVSSTTYLYYLSGQELSGDYYALAGAVQIDGSGTVLNGVQDYNNGSSITSSQPTGDTISGGSLTVDPNTGQGTLSVTTNNTAVGVAGIETFAVQFVNTNHALITQFDGTATSSGSLDFQNPTATLNGNYAFTLAGVDFFPFGSAFGGVFTVTAGTSLSGTYDLNEAGTVNLGLPLTGTVTPGLLGRGTISSSLNYGGTPVVLNYYIVGPEAIRIIDVNTTDSGLGSAFGQGAGTFTDASLGPSVFGVSGVFGNPNSIFYGAAGMFTTDSAGNFSGVADDTELQFGNVLSAFPIAGGTYSIGSNGYGNLTVPFGSLGSISAMGLYMTDPTLNLLDPNNTTTGLGGALLADMGGPLAGGAGILLPQTDPSVASFTSNTGSYAFGAQGLNNCCEFDFVGQGSITGGTLNGIGDLSDPALTFGASAMNFGVTFVGTPLPDPSNLGRYSLLSTNTVPNPLNVTVGTTTTPLDVVIYQASGNQLLWLNEDYGSVFLGSLQIQGPLPLTGIPAARKPAHPKARQGRSK